MPFLLKVPCPFCLNTAILLLCKLGVFLFVDGGGFRRFGPASFSHALVLFVFGVAVSALAPPELYFLFPEWQYSLIVLAVLGGVGN